MKKLGLGIIALISFLFISGCSINIEKDQDNELQEQVNLLQEQLSGLQQKINTLETENAELKNKTTSTQVKKTTTQTKEMDNCPNGDETISRYDGKCCDGNQIIIDGKCGYPKA